MDNWKAIVLWIIIVATIVISTRFLFNFFVYPVECELRSDIYSYTACIRRHAVEENKPELCYKLGSIYRDYCLRDFSLETKNYSVCDLISRFQVRSDCLLGSKVFTDFSNCNNSISFIQKCKENCPEKKDPLKDFGELLNITSFWVSVSKNSAENIVGCSFTFHVDEKEICGVLCKKSLI
ncbi:MAG: hypothetical protein NZ942_03480 [Candidatus Aenigmarchaeota archaeon]|nr:hypothetical protein [Candidatus Aenigmarchaeota archaeon]